MGQFLHFDLEGRFGCEGLYSERIGVRYLKWRSQGSECQFYLFGKTSVARHSGGFLFPLSNGDPLKSRFVGDALLSSLCRDV